VAAFENMADIIQKSEIIVDISIANNYKPRVIVSVHPQNCQKGDHNVAMSHVEFIP